MVLGIANQSALFQRSYATIKFVLTLATGVDVINELYDIDSRE